MRGAVLASLAALTAVPAVAMAQREKPATVSLGIYAAGSPALRQAGANTWVRMSATQAMGRGRNLFAFGELAAAWDGEVESPRYGSGSRQFWMAGGGVGVRHAAPSSDGRWTVEASAGAGLFALAIVDSFDERTPWDPTEVPEAVGVNAGLRLQIALHDRRGVFVEAAHLLPGRLRGMDFRGTSVAIGVRY